MGVLGLFIFSKYSPTVRPLCNVWAGIMSSTHNHCSSQHHYQAWCHQIFFVNNTKIFITPSVLKLQKWFLHQNLVEIQIWHMQFTLRYMTVPMIPTAVLKMASDLITYCTSSPTVQWFACISSPVSSQYLPSVCRHHLQPGPVHLWRARYPTPADKVVVKMGLKLSQLVDLVRFIVDLFVPM